MKNAVFSSEKGCGQSAVVPAAHGEFLTTCYDNGTIGRMSADGTVLPAITQDRDGNKFIGPNDFAPDGRGGIYFTTSGSHDGRLNAKVFYVAADGSVTLKAGLPAQRQRLGGLEGWENPLRGRDGRESAAQI